MRLNRTSLLIGILAGIALGGLGGNLLAQQGGAVAANAQFFVTGQGETAHLWVREGLNLRCVGHGECRSNANANDNSRP